MLPSPTLSFSIPSIHDDLVLQCRVYHPACLSVNTTAELKGWRERAAIVAHPYAPLGGSYDDPVVDLVANTILEQGYIVGTFNFRGAGSSKGRTSWQSKPEQNDYISFIGFMVYYMHHICHPPSPSLDERSQTDIHSDPELHTLSPIQSQAITSQSYDTEYLTPTFSNPIPSAARDLQKKAKTFPRILLAGYSYGAMVTCNLPPIIGSIIDPFQSPLPGSSYAEIRLRAKHLASQQTNLLESWRRSSLPGHRRGRSLHTEDHDLHSYKLRSGNSGNIRTGGEEDLRRASHDSHRSRRSFTLDTPEDLRKRVDRIRSFAKLERHPPRRRHSHGSATSLSGKESTGSGISNEALDVVDGAADKDLIKPVIGIIIELQPAYILVSPLQGFVNHLTTMWAPSWGKNDAKLAIDPTLALFGDDDVFVSAKKLRFWAEKLANPKDLGVESQFRYKEVSGAGHFWHSHESIRTLIQEVEMFVRLL